MGIKLTWFGHAALGLETGGYSLVIDPFFTGNPAASISADKVKPDFILISHGHGDHTSDVIPMAKRTGALVIANFEICGWLEAKGVKNVHSQHLGGGHQHPFGYLKLTHAEHGVRELILVALSNGADQLLEVERVAVCPLDNQRYHLALDVGPEHMAHELLARLASEPTEAHLLEVTP